MTNVQKDVMKKFIEKLIVALQEYGEDVPFIISSLYQSINDDGRANDFSSFATDLYLYSYDITIERSGNEYNGIIDVNIYFEENPSFDYQIKFTTDERLYGYCNCTPDMPDYREDKNCCGHGCDAYFCRFELQKIYNVTSGTWNGDEHDYWEFEDKFYSDRAELSQKKLEEERRREIKELEERITADQKRLVELKGEKFPVDIKEEVEKYQRTLDYMNKLGILGI